MSGMSRRKLLTNAAGAVAAAAGAGLSGITGSAQKTELMPNGGMVPFRLPMGALDYLDQKQYASNMQVVSHVSGPSISSGEPLMVLWGPVYYPPVRRWSHPQSRHQSQLSRMTQLDS
jgi:hypothetical protein